MSKLSWIVKNRVKKLMSEGMSEGQAIVEAMAIDEENRARAMGLGNYKPVDERGENE